MAKKMNKKSRRNIQGGDLEAHPDPNHAPNREADSTVASNLDESDSKTLSSRWPIWIRVVCSLVLLFHLFCVIIAPLAGPPPSSSLSRNAAATVDPYIQAMFLGHGYRFFAPNPGPSHLIEYEILNADGSVTTGRYPDRDEHWPRLYYHRHFMLSETANSVSNIPPQDEFASQVEARKEEVQIIEEEFDLEVAKRLEREIRSDEETFAQQQEMKESLLLTLSQRLLDEHQGAAIRLYSVEHVLPSPLDIELGAKFEDEEFWLKRLIYEFSSGAEWPMEELE